MPQSFDVTPSEDNGDAVILRSGPGTDFVAAVVCLFHRGDGRRREVFGIDLLAVVETTAKDKRGGDGD